MCVLPRWLMNVNGKESRRFDGKKITEMKMRLNKDALKATGRG